MDASSKPSRSEEPATPAESAAYKAEAEKFFADNAPKRAPKPQRSDVFDETPFKTAEPTLNAEELNDAERRNLEQLNREEGPVIPDPVEDLETYHENQYFAALGSLEQQHCPTGQGFIQLGVAQCAPVEISDASTVLSPPKGPTNPSRDGWEKQTQQEVA